MSEVSQPRIRRLARHRLPTLSQVGWTIGLFVLPALMPTAWLERTTLLMRLASTPVPHRVGLPVRGLTLRGVHDSWGAPRPGGRRHEGIDLFAARGTPVVAATEGLVWRVGTDPLGGLVVWILGPGRQLHYYAHLDHQADLRRGDVVAPGDVLGGVGTTGNARGGAPHLHYGIYENGAAIDPYPLLIAPPT